MRALKDSRPDLTQNLCFSHARNATYSWGQFCLLILSYTPNTTQLLRKRIGITPRGWLAWAWAHLRSLPLHPSSAPTRLQMVSPLPPSGKGFLAPYRKGSFPPRAAAANTSATWSDQAGLGSHGELHIPSLGHGRCALSCGLRGKNDWKKRFILIFQMKST